MFRAFLRFLSGEDRFVTIQQLCDAVVSQPLEFAEAPLGGWRERKEYTRLLNEEASLFYRETRRLDGKRVETLDIFAVAHRGGVLVTFIDDEICVLTHNAIKKDVRRIDEDDKRLLRQILLKARHSVYA